MLPRYEADYSEFDLTPVLFQPYYSTLETEDELDSNQGVGLAAGETPGMAI